MTDQTSPLFTQDPRFQKSLQCFQEERWQDGLDQLGPLLEKFPFDHDLRRFQLTMQVRSRIDSYELEEVELARRRQTRKQLSRFGLLIGFIVIVFLGSTTYSSLIQRQLSLLQGEIQTQYSEIELAIKFRNGQNLLLSGRAEEALVIFEEIHAANPELENLEEFMAKAQGVLSLEGQYETALGFMEDEQWEEALAMLEAIAAEDPNFKDVPLLVERAKRNITLNSLVAAADVSFEAALWSDAVSKYEAVRIADATFETEHVEERLFNSYVNAALAVLDDPQAELEELAIADEYFQKALSLRPQDEEVQRIWNRARATVRDRLITRYLKEAEDALVNQEDSVAALQIAGEYFGKARALDPNNEEIALQADFANRYLQALNDFRLSLWDLVITNLEFIYSFDKEYAGGTSRQILYDAYIIRGDNFLATGEFDLSLSDYRRSVELAQDNLEGGALGVYEAQLKVAFTLGRLFDYEGAVLMYQIAVETGDLVARFSGSDPNFIRSIESANQLAAEESFRLAYIRFRDLFNQNDLVYSEFVTHLVEEGQYLSQIARLYNSSIQAIVRANDIADANRIIAGDVLIIPVFPED